MEAYFDDQDQYDMATKLCAKPPPPPRPDPEINVFEAETTVNQLDEDEPSQQPAGVVEDRMNRDEPLSEACLVVVSSSVVIFISGTTHT